MRLEKFLFVLALSGRAVWAGVTVTQNVSVIVNPIVQPIINSFTASNGQLTLIANRTSGPDYTLLSSTNLTDWQTVLTTNSLSLPVAFVITNLFDSDRFYRIQLGP